MLPVHLSISQDIEDYLSFVQSLCDKLADALASSELLAARLRVEVRNWKFKQFKTGPITAERELPRRFLTSDSALLRRSLAEASDHFIRPTQLISVSVSQRSPIISPQFTVLRNLPSASTTNPFRDRSQLAKLSEYMKAAFEREDNIEFLVHVSTRRRSAIRTFLHSSAARIARPWNRLSGDALARNIGSFGMREVFSPILPNSLRRISLVRAGRFRTGRAQAHGIRGAVSTRILWPINGSRASDSRRERPVQALPHAVSQVSPTNTMKQSNCKSENIRAGTRGQACRLVPAFHFLGSHWADSIPLSLRVFTLPLSPFPLP